jgi:hypothetical protein
LPDFLAAFPEVLGGMLMRGEQTTD